MGLLNGVFHEYKHDGVFHPYEIDLNGKKIYPQ